MDTKQFLTDKYPPISDIGMTVEVNAFLKKIKKNRKL
jgi:hypothetical protein